MRQCVAREIGFPVALKILSVDITRKSDIGGVMLDLETAEAVRVAAEAMRRRLHQFRPDAVLQGFFVQAMARRPGGHALSVGVVIDPVFGPVILFGQGGKGIETQADRAVGLPPLNAILARDLISHARVVGLQDGYRNCSLADLDAICRTLIQVSHLITDIPEIAELDINPLLADDSGVVVLDARIAVAWAKRPDDNLDRLAIRPYPQELEQTIEWQGQQLLLMPIKPEDGQEHADFFNALDPEDVRYRMFVNMRELQQSQLARLTQIDYDREMAFIATRPRPGGGYETLGVARAIADPDNVQAEFAIIVRSDIKGRGLGVVLMEKLIGYCRRRGTSEIVGEALPHNMRLLNLATKLGFVVKPLEGDGTMQLRLDLCAQPANVPL